MGRNCGECKFYDRDFDSTPCCNCDGYGSEFRDLYEPGKECDNCRFEDLMGYQEPCDSCMSEDCWKPKVTTEKIDCDSCKHEALDGDEFPCDLCTKENYMFEEKAVEEAPVNKTEIIELPNDFTLIIKNDSIIAIEDGEYHATYTECDLMRAVVEKILGGNC